MTRAFLCCLAVFFLSVLPVRAAETLSILRITPAGEDVQDGRQIVVEFNRPVVPVGRMERSAEEVGITIAPPLECQWRWLNTAALSCNLDDDGAMKPATRYEVTIVPAIAAEDGTKIGETHRHSFTTQRPAVSYTTFRTWKSPVHPVIQVVFTQPVAKNSVATSLYFETGAGRKTARHAVTVTADEDYGQQEIGDVHRVWLIAPQKKLPAAAPVSLRMGAGLVSAEGPERGVAQETPVVTFETFPDLAFAGVKCFNAQDQEVVIASEKPQTAETLCNPMRPVALAFTAPVLRSQVSAKARFSPGLDGGRTDYSPWGAENRDYSMLYEAHQNGRTYTIGLPVGLKAAQDYELRLPGQDSVPFWKKLSKAGSGAVEDQFGRRLEKSVVLKFSTGHRNPNYLLLSDEAVIEKGVDSEVPLYVNNIKTATMHYRRVTPDGAADGLTTVQEIAQVKDVQFAVQLGAREMLDGKTGAVYGRVESDPPVYTNIDSMPHLFATVTPYQVHFKLGHFRSIAWVTDLATGLPVPDASVSVYADSLAGMGMPQEAMAQAKTGADGIAVLPGTETIDPEQTLLRAWKNTDPRLFIRVDNAGDMALMPLTHGFSINTWRLSDDYVPEQNRFANGHMRAWGMTAQGIYKAGDTMQYKIYVRGQDNTALTPPPSQGVFYSLEIIDPMGKTAATVRDVKLDKFGTYAGEFSVPKTAAVGWYNFRLEADFTGKPQEENTETPVGEEEYYEPEVPGKVVLNPMRVLVSDFTPSPFKVTADINGARFRPGDTLTIDTAAKLHSGGAYADAPARVTVTLRSRWFGSDHEAAKGYAFSSFEGERESEQIYQEAPALDDKGEAESSLTVPQQAIVYGVLEIESAVQDDRGKYVAAIARADYAGVDRLAGIKSPRWVYEAGKEAALPVIVVDESGAPVAGVPVAVKIEKQIVSTVKVKGAGNAYLSDTTTEWQEAGSCALTSGAEGVPCAFTPGTAGTYRMTASITDTKGTAHTTQTGLWVTGGDYVQWDDGNEFSLPVVPEKKEYNIGETARYLVKNPYPGAQALVTVERYGVIDTFVQKLEGSTPVIEFPVKPDYLPGFYMSVMVVSPRVKSPPPETGQVDLGKPAFRMAYVTVPVKDPYKEITVDVTTGQEIYRPRDTVTATLVAKPRHPAETPEPVQLAVAVLDEAVFDMIAQGRDAFDPYKGLNSLAPLDVRNYSLLTRLLGRQKFEKKGANPGGDGGSDLDMRNLFKFVSYWNPSVPIDKDGTARISFEAPDNLTGWRVLALAATPSDRMGLGEGGFKVNRPTELRPVMPNQVREGDRFQAGFSVMNRTDAPRTITVSIEAAGDIAGDGAQKKEESITLEPYKRATVFIALEAALLPPQRDVPDGLITLTARAGDAADTDALEFSIPVNKTRIFDVAATYGSTDGDTAQERIAYPEAIYTDAGEVSVVLSPSVIGNVTGAFRYMRDYPYSCWEQLLTRAVMAAHYISLKAHMPASFAWEGADTLPQELLDAAASYQAPGGGMAYFIPRDEYADPYLSAYTALAFRWLRRDGYVVPEEVERRLHDYLLTFLRQDTAPDFYQTGMRSTVRAVALAALAESGKIEAGDITRYEPHLKDMTLFGKAHFLRAALSMKNAAAAKTAADMIMASGGESGGKLTFTETYDDGYERILATPLRDNCAVLDSLLLMARDGDDEGKTLTGDKPMKIVRAVTQARGSRDHWENTQENVFCMNALAGYARAYESVTPEMSVAVALDGAAFGKTAFSSFGDAPVTAEKPLVATDPGRIAVLDIAREGAGRLYYAARLRYALLAPHKDAVNAGIDIRREYSVKRDGRWTLLAGGDAVKRGDLVRVDLFVSAPAARNFVVVNDPVPGGLEPVNRDLATASSVDAAEGAYDAAEGSFWFSRDDWHGYAYARWSFYHQELRHDSVRYYADWLPAGDYHLSYTAQAVAEGAFAVPPPRAEEMYDPDVYGTGTAMALTVGGAP